MNEYKLTQYSHGAGCGCKIAPKVLDSILMSSVAKGYFPQLLVGNEERDDAAVFDLGDGTAIVSTTDLTLVHVLHRHKLKQDEVMIVLYFKASTFKGEPESLELKKFRDIAWHPVTALPEEVSKPTKHVLECIQKGDIYSEFPARNKVLAFWDQLGTPWTGFMDF